MAAYEYKASSLRAGAAQVDISPDMGIQLAGDIGRYRPAQFINDPIYAKALVLESDGRRICILSLEILNLTEYWVQEIRKRAAREFGFDPAAILVHDTQTHSAPQLGNTFCRDEWPLVPPELWWVRGGDPRYNEPTVAKILEAIRQADAALRPVLYGAASGTEGRMAFNRRFVMRDGKVRTHPTPGDPNIRYCEGPIDPELGVVCFATEELEMVAMLLHYTCHPVHGYPRLYVSADWPGAWAEGLRAAYGTQAVGVVLNGCCGNVHHRNHLDPRQVDDYRTMGRVLTESADEVIKRINYTSEAVLDWRITRVPIPIRELDAEELRKARELMAAHPDPIWRDAEHTAIEWDWVYAMAMLDLEDQRKHNDTFDLEIQAFRIGNIGLVAVPGEPFVEAQLRIKLESPTYPTYVAHHCSQYIGYVPTAEALKRGGYETRTSNWSFLCPEGLDMIADTSLALLRELFS